jgi:asparagine synthase (glutamine-hydrolysing)
MEFSIKAHGSYGKIMCGITGCFNFDSAIPLDRPLLEKMVSVLRHRGPDSEGIYLDRQIGLGHTRLSIIDLASGQQPMCNEDGSLWVVYNGEIYNYRELREDLISQGHRFKTTSDTEVLLHLYEERGKSCVEQLNGQFAFALWDEGKQELFLARDRLGVRPLYYTLHQGRFIFGSEIKAIFQDCSIPRRIDLTALDQIFTFWFPLPPRSGFQDIWELPPGHSLTIRRKGCLQVTPYWQLTFRDQDDCRSPSSIHEQGLRDEMMNLLADAVKIRLRADVPVGAYLSGGLDSSIVAALIRREICDRLETFSIGFEEAAFDETPYQSEMVRHLGTAHHPLFCRNEHIGQNVERAVYHMEKPVLRLAPIPLLLLSRGVREAGIKVVLTGEGSDEIFGGYDIYKETKIRRFWARYPKSRLRPLLLRRLYPYLPGLKGQSFELLKGFFSPGLTDTADPFYSHRPRWRVAGSLKNLYSETTREDLRDYDAIEDLRSQLPAEFSRWDPFSQSQYLETSYLMPGYILSSQGDRVGMANAVEGRFPFLDHRVVEFSSRLPTHLKMRGLKEKYLLKRGAKELLPERILRRTKQPYRAPGLAALFADGKPREEIRTFLSETSLREAGLFSPASVSALLKKAGQASAVSTKDEMALVGILTTQMLWQRFIKG